MIVTQKTDTSQFYRKSFFNPFTYHFHLFLGGIVFVGIAISSWLDPKNSTSFLPLIVGIIAIAASLIFFSTIPRFITVSDKGIEIDGELCSWEDITRVESRLTTLNRVQLVFDIYLNDDQNFYIKVDSYKNNDQLERNLVRHAKAHGIFKIN